MRPWSLRTAMTVSISPLSRRISAGWPLTCAGCSDAAAVILARPVASRRATLPAPAMGRRTAARLNLVAAWSESTVFTEAERPALALAEEGTRLADTHHGVSDQTWGQVPTHTTTTRSPRWSAWSP